MWYLQKRRCHIFFVVLWFDFKGVFKIFRPINLLIVYYDNRVGSQGNIGINGSVRKLGCNFIKWI